MLPDPRRFPAASGFADDAACHALVGESLGAATGAEAARAEAALRQRLRPYLDGDGAALARLMGTAPSVDVHRFLVRAVAAAFASRDEADATLALVPFVIPVVLVAGAQGGGDVHGVLSGVLPDVATLSAILQDNGALAGNRTSALAPALVGSAALDPSRLPALYRAARLPAESGGAVAPLPLAPAPVTVTGGVESVHLRFLVGTALAGPRVDLFRDTGVGRWGMPLANALAARLAASGVSLLALPRPAQPLATAVDAGLSAQREVSAQVFASNALRRLRAAFGEPTAVLSAHALDDGGGEVRLSLSTPFDARDAEGFRARLHAGDRIGDVESMLRDLLADCRVTDVREVPGVHPDRDAGTGVTLLFKPETMPPPAAVH